MPTTFEPGSSLSHYRVIAPIGAGGMGEVYKAQDLTLERPVALKILPPELVRNDERVRRFVQEAKSASSLNHPNIVTIHEIGQADAPAGGAEGGRPIHFIAMELIDGTTLRRKIHDEQTDLRTLLVYMAQVADGLAKAHGAGIVHRDLKPENIMITRDGFAKVLDFGLAKLSIKKSADATSDPTAVRNDTREGALLGTVGYMSPEQVKAKGVDHRTDVFSFGSILYEAATRRRPFDADSDVDIMHRIVHDKPVPIDEINPDVPAELRRMIRRCLAKDPDKRFQSMKDLSLELAEIVDEFEELSASASSGSVSGSRSAEIAVPPRRRTFWVSLAAAALIAVAALGFAVYQWTASHSRATAPTTFASMQLTRLTSSGNVIDAAISPDGKYVAQVLRNEAGLWSVSVRQVATSSDVTVVSPSPTLIRAVSFSPDANYVHYIHRDQEVEAGYASLFQVPTLGGPPRKLVFDVDTAAAFSPDGKQIAFARGYPQDGKNALVIVNAEGGGERTLIKEQRLQGPYAPSWSPDGKKILWPALSTDGGYHATLREIDLASGKVRDVGSRWVSITASAWLPDGSGIVLIGTRTEQDRAQIWTQPYPEGELVRITNDLNEYGGLSMTADGKTLLTLRIDQLNDLRVSAVGDETGGSLLSPGTVDQTPLRVSAAASGAVVYAFRNEGGIDIAVIDAPGAAPRVLTRDGKSSWPSITADGKTVVFQSWREGDLMHLHRMDVDGSNAKQLTNGRGEWRAVVVPDGSAVFHMSIGGGLWKLPLRGGQPQKIADRMVSAFTVESTRIAYTYQTLDGIRAVQRLAVIPLAGGPPLHDFEFPGGGGGALRWAPDGDAVTAVRHRGPSQIIRQPLDGSEPTVLTRFRSKRIASFDWMPDGKLVMSRGEQRSDAVLISGFR